MSQGEAFQAGLRIGKYELTRKLGEGGFGVLFAARDTSLDRELAIKFLHPHHSSNPDVVKRFVQEARSIAKVVHPGVVTVYESGEVWGTGTRADGAAFIIMELLHGDTLTQRMKNSGGRLAPATAMEICRQIASALEAAHRQGVVHRDLKPDNVMLVNDLALTLGERAKVLDFGIAKMATAAPSGATMAGMVFGTPNYMSPEQCKSAADANHSSDIYSLGCILFELVTGRTPFEGGMAELIAHHILTPPPVPSQIIPGLPPHIDDVIAAMLAKDPNNRPASMTVVEAILEERRLIPAHKSGGRTRTLAGARLATSPPPMFGKPMAPGERPHIPGVPDSGPVPSAQTAPAAVATPQPPAHGSPTTLSSAAGIAAKLERKASAKWWIAIPIVALAAVGTVLALGRGGDSESAETPTEGSAIVTKAASTEAGSDTTTTTGSAATGSAATGSAATGSAATGSAATGSAATGSAATGSAATGSAATGSAASASGSAATATTTGTTTTGTTTGSAATATTTGTKTTGTATGSAATTTKTTSTATGSAATTTKTTGTTTGSAGTTTKTTGATAGSASKPPIKTTKPPPGPGSAAKKCQGRSCILDGDF